jgi:cytochrome c-type biogenesis protein
MIEPQIALGAAFVAGLASFLAPCFLPIIPGFLAYLAGTSTEAKGTARLEIFFNSVFFVLGFSTVFATLGVLLNTVLAHMASDVHTWLARAGGILIITFGLYLLGLIRIPFLERDHKWNAGIVHSRYVTSFLFGLAFAAGWTPCVGPALGAIIGLTASEPSLAFVLLLAYALGLGIPFILVGLFTAQATFFIEKHMHIFRYVNLAFGGLLIVIGTLVFMESMSYLANFELVNQCVGFVMPR